ncbi:hypothetical protein LY78DRAFT_42103 [Colletotrichum sublineola]|uniref:Putative heterokaryon incompatibility protein n=1 Tax=Colletotrichum sublineola TaxID=1173701 RepID=A0A066XKL0_COLSU|nr:hypothetical protein LY78DRAFT_42103 [Colletotrichum sublineola]KDN69703.1 putative heterokaryon incompatibility protein [Colletotrichum sublineola]
MSPASADDLLLCVRRLARLPPRPPRYIYEPLAKGQFRLLHLLAGAAGEDVVRVRLVVEAVDKAPAYHAVSYAWGDPGRTAGILCEGAEIRVTTNLFDALRRWRHVDEDVVLWADAACIDQKNTLEKTHQVGLMADIYSRAASVLVWLGDNDAGLEGIETLVDAALRELPEVVDDPARNMANAVALAGNIMEDAAKQLDWAPLRSLLGHIWFERKWVFQEAILNEQTWLHYGRFRLPLGPVSEVGLRMATFGVEHYLNDPLDSSVSAYPLRLHSLAIMRISQWFLGKQPITLFDAIKATRNFRCTDPRDHILGVFGHTSDIERDSILLRDNLYSLPVQECYLRFVKAQLLEKRNLAVLAFAPQKVFSDALCPWWSRPYFRWRLRRLPGLPSWVPDLRLQEVETLPSYTFRYGKFSAGGAETGTIEVIDDRVLRCSGLVVDVVEDGGVFFLNLQPSPKPTQGHHLLSLMGAAETRTLLHFHSYYRACVRLASPSGSEDVQDLAPELLASLWKTMTCERAQLSDRIEVDLLEKFKAFVAGMDTWLTTEDPEAAKKALFSFIAAGQLIEKSVIGFGVPRRFFRTAEGRFCMAPREARVGDVICVLLGSEVPFVIRPTRRGMYEMIGEAYVSGIMDGEALSGRYDKVDIMLE